MSGWVSIVVLLIAVAAVALMRERWRLRGVEKWAAARGWTRLLPVPAEGPQPAANLVARMTIHGGRIWGLVLDGTVDGASVTVAEHESSQPGRKQGVWHTIVTWPIAGAQGPLVMSRGRGSKAVAAAAGAIISTVGEPIAKAVGVPKPDDTRRLETPGGWVALGEPGLLTGWFTPEKMRELDAWPHGGEFVRDAGFGGWRVRGFVTTARLQQMLEQIPAARRLLQ